MRNARRFHFALLCIVAVVLGWSGWRPYDRFTWWLEVAPGLVGILVLLTTYRRFQFTSLVYTLIALHICVLCVGGHYTYARVPAFDWLRPIFERAAVAHTGSVAWFALPGRNLRMPTEARAVVVQSAVLEQMTVSPLIGVVFTCLALPA
jgi:uncharacterized membrane protein YjdF